MSDIETILAEMFGFQKFEPDEKLQNMIEDTLNRCERYEEKDFRLRFVDLAAAVGGTSELPADSERIDKK